MWHFWKCVALGQKCVALSVLSGQPIFISFYKMGGPISMRFSVSCSLQWLELGRSPARFNLTFLNASKVCRTLLRHRTQSVSHHVKSVSQIATRHRLFRTLVEPSIERVKKFRLLGKRIPLTLSPLINQLVFVVCCLVNFQDPLVNWLRSSNLIIVRNSVYGTRQWSRIGRVKH